jgi:hypothetical protein
MIQPILSRAKFVEVRPLTSTTLNAVAWVEARKPIKLKTYKPFAENATSNLGIKNNTWIF